MEGRSAASPHRSSYSSPLDSQDCGWGLQDFSDFNSVDVMSPASFRGQGFSYGDDVDKMFRNSHEQADFNEALRAFESSGDFIDDKQVVMAAAAAAGLNKGGLKRTAFSMGDLQALQPPTSGPPSPPQMQPQRSGSNLSVAKAPRLESVPEGAVASVATPSSIPAATDLDFSDMLSGHQPFSESVTDPLDDLGLGHFADSLLDVKPVIDWGGTNGQPGPSHSMPSPMYFEQQPSSNQGGRVSELMLDSHGGSLAPNDVHGMGLSAESKDDPAMSSLAESFLASTSGGSHQHQHPPQLPQQQQRQQPQHQPHLPRPHQPLMQVMQAHHLRPPMPQGPMGPGPGIRPIPGLALPLKQETAEKFMRRSQSAVELRSLASLPRSHSEVDLKDQEESALAELTTPEGHTYKVGRLSNEERAQKILKYRQKRHERNFNKRIKYQCRKTLADSRPRVRGRFARNDDAGAVMPHETKKALAEKAKKEKQDTSSAQPAKPPSVQPFMPSVQGGQNQMSFVPMSRPAGAMSRPSWPPAAPTPAVSPFIPAAAPNWPSQPTFIPTPHDPSQSMPMSHHPPSGLNNGPNPHSMGGRSGKVSPPSQASMPGRVGSGPTQMGGPHLGGRSLGGPPRHSAPAAQAVPKMEPMDHSYPQWLPAPGAWPSPGGSYGSQDHLLEQLDQQLDQQLPLSADGAQPFDSGNLGFMPFDL